jgi:hypothetical protein
MDGDPVDIWKKGEPVVTGSRTRTQVRQTKPRKYSYVLYLCQICVKYRAYYVFRFVCYSVVLAYAQCSGYCEQEMERKYAAGGWQPHALMNMASNRQRLAHIYSSASFAALLAKCKNNNSLKRQLSQFSSR